MSTDTPTQDNPEAVWNEVAKEREAEVSPSIEPVAQPDLTAKQVDTESQGAPAEETAPKAAAPDDATKKEPDPFAGISPELAARLQKLEALETQLQAIPHLQRSVKTAEGRVAAMQRELDVAKNAAKAVGDAPSKAQIAAAAGSTDKWDSLKQDFPEWADATEQFVKASLAGLTPQQAKGVDLAEVNAFIAKRLDATRVETAKAIEEAKVEGKHEDWLSVIQSRDFDSWFHKQDPDVQKLAFSEKGRDAIRMIDLFKSAKAMPVAAVQAQRANKLAAAVTSKPGASAPVSKTVDQMSAEELWNYEAQRARKRGAATGLNY